MTTENTAAPAAPAADVAATTNAPESTSQPAATPAEPAAEPKSPLDAVLKVYEERAAEDKPAEPAEDAPPAGEQTPAEQPGEEKKPEEAEERDPTEDEIAKMGRGEKNRVLKLLGQRNEAYRQVEHMKPAAENWEKFSGWVVDQGLEHDDVVRTLSIAALSRTNPAKAYEQLEPIYLELRKRAGLDGELPADLKERVDKGLVDDESAREMARLRKARELDAQEQEQRNARQQQRSEQERVGALANRIASTIQVAESTMKRNDPDYAVIAEDVKDEVEASLLRARDRGELPRNEAEAKALFAAAVEKIKSRYAKFAPRRGSTAPTPSGGSVPNSMVVAPKSPLEVVEAVAAGKTIKYT